MALPLRAASVDVVVAAFLLNHMQDPARCLTGVARVLRPGGAVLGSTWAATDEHPAKPAIEQELVALGWERPAWYAAFKTRMQDDLGTPAQLATAAASAGLVDIRCEVVRVSFGDLAPRGVVDYRLSMPPVAPFVAALPAAQRDLLIGRCVRAVAELPPFEAQMLVLSSRVAA
jgi:SAM-dependent methyltransferase